jgi:hypothetical protein
MNLKMNITMPDYASEYLQEVLAQRMGYEFRCAYEAQTDKDPKAAEYYFRRANLAANLGALLLDAAWTASCEEPELDAKRVAPSPRRRPRRSRRVRGSNVHGRERSAPAGKPTEA